MDITATEDGTADGLMLVDITTGGATIDIRPIGGGSTAGAMSFTKNIGPMAQFPPGSSAGITYLGDGVRCDAPGFESGATVITAFKPYYFSGMNNPGNQSQYILFICIGNVSVTGVKPGGVYVTGTSGSPEILLTDLPVENTAISVRHKLDGVNLSGAIGNGAYQTSASAGVFSGDSLLGGNAFGQLNPHGALVHLLCPASITDLETGRLAVWLRGLLDRQEWVA